MPNAVWTGSISFGLVTIPVRLFPATAPQDVRFHLVDERGRRVRYRRFVEAEAAGPASREEAAEAPLAEGPPPVEGDDPGGALPETEIAYDDLKRGYESERGMVVLDRDEIESLRPRRSREIEIEDFVELRDVDPVYFEKSYVLGPRPGGEKPYVLLLRALETAGRIGIGRFVLRTKPHLVAIRPAGGRLGLETLFFGDEVRDGRDLARGVAGVEVSTREVELARKLISMLDTTWDPDRYADTYREELLRRIEEASPVIQEEEPGAPAAGPRVEELMDALKASVEQARKKGTARSRTRSA